VDADKNYFDGAKTYRVTLPKGIPLPARRQSELSVTGRQARRRRLDDHSLPRYSPQASSAATGFRRCRAKAGLRFFVSTAHSNHSLLRAGDPEKSRRLAWAAARCGIGDASTSSDLGQNRHCRLVPSVANRSTSEPPGPGPRSPRGRSIVHNALGEVSAWREVLLSGRLTALTQVLLVHCVSRLSLLHRRQCPWGPNEYRDCRRIAAFWRSSPGCRPPGGTASRSGVRRFPQFPFPSRYR